MRSMAPYLWQSPDWPRWQHDAAALQPVLSRVRLAQGRMLGLAGQLDLVALGELQLQGWADEAIATAQIEGEVLQVNSVRASAARRLGLDGARPHARDARTEATLELLQAAAQHGAQPLDAETLHGWHAALLHHEAPPSAAVPDLMAALLAWFDATRPRDGVAPALDGVVRAGLVHLWFETVHPYEDGNGCVGRALAELALAQDLRSAQRLSSLSQQLWADRAGYYAQLQAATGRADLDVTPWLLWFAGCVERACDAATAHMQAAFAQRRWWTEAQTRLPQLSASQRKMLARLHSASPDGFLGDMTTEKYVKLTGVSRATAWRELDELQGQQLLVRSGQGRGTRYALNVDLTAAS
jgi:Fic family protein